MDLLAVQETALVLVGVGHAPFEGAGLGILASAQVAAASVDKKSEVQRAEALGGEQSGAASCQEKALRCHGLAQLGQVVPGLVAQSGYHGQQLALIQGQQGQRLRWPWHETHLGEEVLPRSWRRLPRLVEERDQECGDPHAPLAGLRQAFWCP